jgi:hypothetical protein
MEISLFWNRIAAYGWASMYSLLLHFFLILTDSKTVLKKWWVYILIYLPALLTIYLYAVPNNLSALQYHLVRTAYGWINIAGQTGWDWFFNIYYGIFYIAALALVLRWGKRSSDYTIKKQSRLIFISMMIAIVLGTLTDTVLGFYITIPQVAPIIIILPISIFYYAIRHYGLMNPRHSDEDESILTQSSRIKVYNCISAALIAGGILYFFSQNLSGYLSDDFVSIWWFNTILFIASAVIQLVLRLKIKEDYQDMINAFIIAILIPTVIIRFIQYASVTVWAFPIILIIFSLVFNKRLILAIIAISVILTQISVWMLAPSRVPWNRVSRVPTASPGVQRVVFSSTNAIFAPPPKAS